MKHLAMAVVAVALGAAPARATVMATDFFDAPGHGLGDAIYPTPLPVGILRMTVHRPLVPTSVAIYGALGLIPFWAPTAIAWARPELTDATRTALALYAALILSFLGGARWAFAVARPAPSAVTVSLAMLPTLAGFGLLLAPESARLPGLAVALAAMGAWDLRPGDPPPWYPLLRIPLTLGAVGGVVLGAVVMR